ncbi:MAG: GNAT family N-acetyltransferase [Aggregatilineales bacterium]
MIIADRLQSALATELALLLVAEADGVLSGFVFGQALNEKQAEIAALAIDLHRYHAGVGRQLVYALCAQFTERGISRFVVTAPRSLAVEQAFWHSLKTECNLELL